MSKESSNNKVIITVAIITSVTSICAAVITGLFGLQAANMQKKAESTSAAVQVIATDGGSTQIALQNIVDLPTSTPYPTEGPLSTYTPQPTFTAYPTYTPFPTNAPLPTQDVSLPFLDNFDVGLSPSWRLLTGTPLITDGKIKSVSGRIIFEVGNESLKNLTLTFDLSGLRFHWDEVAENDNIFLLIGKNVRFYFGNVTRMQVFENNQWVNLDGAGVDYQLQHTFKIVTLDNKYEIYMDGQLLHQYQYGSSNSGPVQISMMDNVRLDNFSLSSP